MTMPVMFAAVSVVATVVRGASFFFAGMAMMLTLKWMNSIRLGRMIAIMFLDTTLVVIGRVIQSHTQFPVVAVIDTCGTVSLVYCSYVICCICYKRRQA